MDGGLARAEPRNRAYGDVLQDSPRLLRGFAQSFGLLWLSHDMTEICA